MKGMTKEEARNWCLQAGLEVEDNILRYGVSNERRFFIAAPEEQRRILVFSRAIAAFGGEARFSGGLLWFQRWDIGSPQLVRVGWQIVEDLRRAHGDLQTLDIAPAECFRDDELSQLHAFLLQVIGFGWVADFVPSTRSFFVHFKDDRQVRFTTTSSDTFKDLRTAFSQWNPTDEDPMAARLAELESRHKRVS